MVDATTTPGSGASSPTGPAGGPLSDSSPLGAQYQQFSDRQKQLTGELNDATRGATARARADEDNVSKLQPPQMQPLPPPPQPKTTSPEQEWGSIAMLVAGLGGMFVRQHAIAALNAGADVLKAYHEGDATAAKTAYDTWKIANENTMKQMDYQLQTYRAIMADASRREGLDIREGSQEATALRAELAANGRAFSDDVMLHNAQRGDLTAIRKWIEDQARVADRLDKASANAVKGHDYVMALNELRQSPDYQKASPLERYKMELSLNSKKAPEALQPKRGGGEAKDIATAQHVYATQFKDPATGQLTADAPKFDQWYKSDWPKWGVSDDKPAAGASADPTALVTDGSQYDALPSGTFFTGPDGLQYQKP